MSRSFSETIETRNEIERALTALALSRGEGLTEPGAADIEAHKLILRYLREVIGSGAFPVANAFAAAVGLAEPSGVDDVA